MIGVLDPVDDASSVGVRVVGIGGSGGIGVRDEDPGIGVEPLGGGQPHLGAVEQPVPVGVLGRGIGLPHVGETVSVGVLGAVEESVVVGVVVEGIGGVVAVDLGAVEESVAVRVGICGVRTQRGLLGVGQPVAVVVETAGHVVHTSVAVVVDPVADLHRVGVDRRVVVVAVAVVLGVTVAVVVVALGTVVGDPVAVVVLAVAHLGAAGVAVGIGVVAVAVVLGQAVSVVVETLGVLVDGAVTVLVHAVADLGGAGVDAHVAIVAVPAVLAEPVAVIVVATGPVVDDAVAILIHTVADLDGIGVDRRIHVVAVPALFGVSVAVVVVALGVLVDGAVAVVVRAVADLGAAGLGGRVRVVAVSLAFGDAVAVCVLLVCGQDAVAVVVQAVADLRGTREHRGDEVVAVPVAWRVSVAVQVVADTVVDDAVAVVVEGVAELGCAVVDVGVVVVAVALADHLAVAVHVDLVGLRMAVAVVVEPVADLGGTRVDGRFGVVAVQIRGEPVAVAVHGAFVAVVHAVVVRVVVEPVAVAVAVHVVVPHRVSVDHLGGRGDAVVVVVVVAVVGVAVSVAVHGPLVQIEQAVVVAVVVQGVDDLVAVRVHGRAAAGLHPVVDPVAVRVDVVGVSAEDHLHGVGDAVAVRVRVQVGHGRVGADLVEHGYAPCVVEAGDVRVEGVGVVGRARPQHDRVVGIDAGRLHVGQGDGEREEPVHLAVEAGVGLHRVPVVLGRGQDLGCAFRLLAGAVETLLDRVLGPRDLVAARAVGHVQVLIRAEPAVVVHLEAPAEGLEVLRGLDRVVVDAHAKVRVDPVGRVVHGRVGVVPDHVAVLPCCAGVVHGIPRDLPTAVDGQEVSVRRRNQGGPRDRGDLGGLVVGRAAREGGGEHGETHEDRKQPDHGVLLLHGSGPLAPGHTCVRSSIVRSVVRVAKFPVDRLESPCTR